ncbi:MAG TPA: serine hydrolase domain-containing protein [Candidatus Eisenbacteria bacterium]|jgi:CubicO group peptidase (beta-lactamase class C family)|nr:serine hydrolase domain-containing protein [Candidatus Eisenbacteria bacterium]
MMRQAEEKPIRSIPLPLVRRTAMLLAVTVVATASLSAQDRGLEARVDTYLAPYVKGNNFLGAVLIGQADRVLVSRAYGDASCELRVPNSPDTRFHIASVSKPFTAAAILLLQDRGLLSLSDPVSRFLPGFPNGQKITLQHLLTHTSGITNVNNLPEYATASRFPQTPASLIEMFKSKPLGFEPGAKYEYSNSNYNILAFVIEQVSHESYGEFLRENIFVPLGLQNTGHDGDASDVITNAASGYQPRGIGDIERSSYIDWSAKTGNGSLYSTTNDLLRFVRAYGQGRLLPRKTVDQIWVEKSGNNYGWFVRKRHGLLAVASNGRSPGFTSSVEYYPAKGLTVIVLSNSYSPVSQSPVAEDLAAIALGENPAPVGAILPVEVGADQLQRLAGTYRFDETFFRPSAEVRIRIEGKGLILDWGGDTRSDLVPVSATEFIDRQFWSRIVFDQTATGFRYSGSFQAKRVPTH